MARTVAQIVRDVKSRDEGYCNPMKLKLAQETYDEGLKELLELGYTKQEAKALLDE